MRPAVAVPGLDRVAVAESNGLIKSLNYDNIYSIFDPQGVLLQVKLG